MATDTRDLTEAQIRKILELSRRPVRPVSDPRHPNGPTIADESSYLDPATVAALCNMALRSSAAEAKIVEQAADVVGFAEAIAELDAKLPGAFWHVAKGRLCESEPLYAALILFGEEEVGHGEHLTSIAEAVRIATSAALAEIGSGK